MNAQVIIGKSVYTIPDASELTVRGELVEILRSAPDGSRKVVAVAGEDLLVALEPVVWEVVDKTCPDGVRAPALNVDSLVPEWAVRHEPVWLPVGEPID